MKPMSNPRPEPAPLLAFGAHPDDIEFGCGGVVALETRAGRAGALGRLLARRVGQPRHARGATRSECRAAARALGASLELIELDGDAHLEVKAAHAIRLAGVIRRLRPAIVLAPTPVENQHPDHSRLGRLVRDAARIARYGGVAELRELPPHAIEQLFYLRAGAGGRAARHHADPRRRLGPGGPGRLDRRDGGARVAGEGPHLRRAAADARPGQRPAGRRRPRHRPLSQRPARRRFAGAAGPQREPILT